MVDDKQRCSINRVGSRIQQHRSQHTNLPPNLGKRSRAIRNLHRHSTLPTHLLQRLLQLRPLHHLQHGRITRTTHVRQLGFGSNQLPRKHRLNGTSILDNLLDINGKRTQSIPKRHLRSMERTSRRLSQHHTIRLPKLFDNDVQRSQSNRSNKPNHDAVATRMGTQRRTKPKLGITNQHSPRRKPNQHRLHHTPLLLLTIQQFTLLEQRLNTDDGLTT